MYGARSLKRAIQDKILDELALEIIEKRVTSGETVHIDFINKKVIFNLPN